MKTKQKRTLFTAAVLAISLWSNSVQSGGVLGVYFLSQAMDALSQRAFGALRGDIPKQLPSFVVSTGTASLINAKLPMETQDGFVLLLARSPAPGALEVTVQTPKGSQFKAAELDKAWGRGVIDLFCSHTDTVWTRWILMGGTAGLTVRDSTGTIIRQYGATLQDCKTLGF